MVTHRTVGSWLLRVLGAAAACACLMAPTCADKFSNPVALALNVFIAMGFVDPPAQNAPPVPAVPYRALLVRQSDCSLTRLVFDQNNVLLSSYSGYQDFIHQLSGLTTTADRFAGGCKEPTTGIASQFGASLGRISSGNYAIATLTSHGVQITIATSNYTVASTTPYAIGDPTVLSSTSTATADLNGDGIADLVVASAGATFDNPVGTLTVFLGKGDGTFLAPQTINLPFNVQGFTIDDLNNDGKLDIVAVAFTDKNAGSSHLAVLLGRGDGSFAAPALGPPNVTGNNVVTGDFNGDGRKDVATTDGYILLGNGDGTFTVPFGVQFLTQFIGIAAGDFNRDGRTDLAITTDSSHGTVDIYLGTGDGRFTRSASYAAIYGAQSISTTDLDGDGNVDLFIGTQSAGIFSADVVTDGEFQSLLGRGDGTFTAAVAFTSLATRTNISHFDLADVTGDGKADLVFVDPDPTGAYLSVYSGNGDTTFTRKAQTSVSSYAGGPILLADVDRDGRTDAVFATGSGGSAGVAISLGYGDGRFQAQVGYSIPGSISSLIAADLNGDGKPDLIFTADAGSGVPSTQATLQVMLNRGDGTFLPPQQLDAKPYQFFVAAADVNGDGKLDLVVTAPGNIFNSIAGSTTLYLGNGNGSFQAPAALSGGANPGPVAIADLNNDGKPDIVIAGSSSASAGSVNVLLGNGNGTFQSSRSTAAGFVVPNSIATGDVDKDGKPDVIVSECCGLANTWLLPANGDGTFRGAAPLPLGLASGNVRLVDLNADGYPELVLASNQYAVEVFPNAGASQPVTTPTATSLSSSALSITAGQALTLTATVTAGSGVAIPTGSTTFFDGAAAIGTVIVDSNGRAVLTTSALALGSHTLMATYGGSPAFATSGSSTVSVTIVAAPTATSTALSASATSVQSGQSVTFTATVSATAEAATPAGNVTFSDSSTQLGTVTLDGSGKAMLATTSLGVGSHAITAAYLATASFAGSTSSAVTVAVTSPPSSSGGGDSGGGSGGGGATGAWSLLALATLAFMRRRRAHTATISRARQS